MVEMIRKLIPVEVKEVGDRTLEIAGSTEDEDRMGDIIRSSGWKLTPFKKNPVFMWAHDYHSPPIGRANRVWVDKETNKLMFKVEFAPPETYEFADTIYKLYKGGFLHATSVGFIPLEWEGKDEENPNPKGNVFTKQELLELSAVPVPANAEALVSARDEGLITVKEFEVVSQLVEDEITKPEETEDYYRIPVKGEEGKHEDHRIRTIDIDKKKGIKALYCGECKKVITYLFSKEDKYGWTMASAQEWVDEHSKAFSDMLINGLIIFANIPSKEDRDMYQNVALDLFPDEANQIPEAKPVVTLPEPKPISQAELGDELDFILRSIKEVGLNDEQKPIALNLASAIIMRATGSDIPDDILSKVGTVLNDKNEERLREIRQLVQEVIDSVPVEEKGEKQVPLKPEIDPLAEAKQRAIDVVKVANLVIAKLKGKRIKGGQ